MPPAVVAVPAARRPFVPNRRLDRVFFALMIVAMWATVIWGFGRTYFLVGMVAAPLPNRLIHVHAVAFTLWMVLLLVQAMLVVTGNIRVHRTLGMGGFGLAIVMVALGVLAAVDQMKRGHAPPGVDPVTFFIVPLSDILIFAALVFFAYRFRGRPELHKRLILFATLEIIGAAIARLPVHILELHPPLQEVVTLAFLLAIVAFDLFSLRRVSKATMWCSALLAVVHLTRIPIGATAAFHSFGRMFLTS